MTCWYFGITRQPYTKWLQRNEEQGVDALHDRSRHVTHASPLGDFTRAFYGSLTDLFSDP